MTGAIRKPGKTALLAVAMAAGWAAVSAAGLFDGIFGRTPAETARAAGVVETADEVTIPLKALDSGKALFLQTRDGERTLHFFALKGADGKYRSALDACDVCYRMNRGYRQEGDRMVCNNCGQTFPSSRIGEVKGGCNPHPLAHRIEGARMVIRKADVAAGRDYFARRRA
ncbi:MAG: Fe-S-containing protein [Gemmatimonadota bacterium]